MWDHGVKDRQWKEVADPLWKWSKDVEQLSPSKKSLAGKPFTPTPNLLQQKQLKTYNLALSCILRAFKEMFLINPNRNTTEATH